MDAQAQLRTTGPDSRADARAARIRARSPLARIRRALADGIEPPSLGELGPTIASAALSTRAEVARIAELALFDPAMLLRLLRAANSSAFLTRSGDAVVSPSRAIMLLGYDQAREMALTLPLLEERIPDPDHRALVRAEYAQANVAATLTRRLLEARHAAVAEEGAVAAMLGCSGRILAAIHAPQALVAIDRAVEEHRIAESAAARRILGAGFEELTHEALAAWRMPARLAGLLRAATALRPREPELAADWLPLSIACATEMTDALLLPAPAERKERLAQVQRKFGRAIDIDARRMQALVEATTEEVRRIERIGGTPPGAPSGARLLASHLAGETRVALPAPRPPAEELERALADSGSPEDALALLDTACEGRRTPSGILAAAIGLLDTLVVERSAGFLPALALALAGIRHGMDYTRVCYFGRDDVTGTYRPQLAIGTDLERLRDTVFMGVQADSLLHAALDRGVDLHIGDASAPKVRERLPAWFATAFPDTRSFLILPVRIDERPVGFILADRDRLDPQGPGPVELDRIRALRNRIAAMRQAGVADFG